MKDEMKSSSFLEDIFTTVWSLLLIESTYLACLVNTYAVRGRRKILCGGSRLAARPRSRAA